MPQVLCSHVDAFARQKGQGNSAAVCFPTCAADSESDGGVMPLTIPSDQWMQQVAADFGYPETAFAYPDGEHLRLRWFTPKVEVDLCGHATLATAWVMRELSLEGRLPLQIRTFWTGGHTEFLTRSGVLMAESTPDGITLDFPATPVSKCELPAGLEAALGIPAETIVFSGRSPFDVFIHLQTAKQVRDIAPRMADLASIPARGILVTALGDHADHDFLSRFFAPACGIPEDPVTGSAHCALASYWAPLFGRNILFGYQASSRGGHVRMDLRNDRVRLSGQAVVTGHSTVERS